LPGVVVVAVVASGCFATIACLAIALPMSTLFGRVLLVCLPLVVFALHRHLWWHCAISAG
jgi:hypothetical protein